MLIFLSGAARMTRQMKPTTGALSQPVNSLSRILNIVSICLSNIKLQRFYECKVESDPFSI